MLTTGEKIIYLAFVFYMAMYFGYVCVHTTQDAFGFSHCQDTPMVYGQLIVPQRSQVLSAELSFSQSISRLLLQGLSLSQVKVFTFFLSESKNHRFTES